MTPAWRRSALCMPPSWAGNSPSSIDSSGVIHQRSLMYPDGAFTGHGRRGAEPHATEEPGGGRAGAAEPPRYTETRLTLGQLRTFLAVASTGSVRAAADQLVVTQPAVSSALAAVRKQVGVALVTRDG